MPVTRDPTVNGPQHNDMMIIGSEGRGSLSDRDRDH